MRVAEGATLHLSIGGEIDGFRCAITGQSSVLSGWTMMLSMLVVLTLFDNGIWYFRKMERTFADVI
jgi:lipopolysaccharide transport system permease protein